MTIALLLGFACVAAGHWLISLAERAERDREAP